MLELVAEYVDRLDTAAEDRLLTTKLVPSEITAENGTAGCIIGVATGAFKFPYGDSRQHRLFFEEASCRGRLIGEFNHACKVDPIGTTEFIRNRILENRFAKLEKKELETADGLV